MWGGLLRPGELTNATRGDLLLPDDVQSRMPFCLLAIKEPKTRFSNARHQSAKVDVPDLLQVIRLAFLDLSDSSFLWPYSAQTLRLRLKQVLTALKLQSESLFDSRALDLGSFRAGGATFIIQATEDGDLLQRRGRWANRKMMEIYVQDVSAILYLKRVPDDVRHHVLQIAGAFPQFLQEAWKFKRAKIPENVWYLLFSKRWDFDRSVDDRVEIMGGIRLWLWHSDFNWQLLWLHGRWWLFMPFEVSGENVRSLSWCEVSATASIFSAQSLPTLNPPCAWWHSFVAMTFRFQLAATMATRTLVAVHAIWSFWSKPPVTTPFRRWRKCAKLELIYIYIYILYIFMYISCNTHFSLNWTYAVGRVCVHCEWLFWITTTLLLQRWDA